MDTESLKMMNKEQDSPLVRPDVYTLSELFRSLIGWTRPIMDVLMWQLPIVSGSWLILGLAAIYLLTNFSLLSLLGLAGLIVMGLVMLYAAIQRVEPYQELKDHPLMAKMRVPPETVKLVADRLHNWINRWLATGQCLIFGQDYRPSVLVAIMAFCLSTTCVYFGSTAVIMMAYCLAFILPTWWPLFVSEWNYINRLPWPPRMMRLMSHRQYLRMLSHEIIYEEDEGIRDKEDNAEGQQPEARGI